MKDLTILCINRDIQNIKKTQFEFLEMKKHQCLRWKLYSMGLWWFRHCLWDYGSLDIVQEKNSEFEDLAVETIKTEIYLLKKTEKLIWEH